MYTIELKRAYEPASPSDGFRVYIDRLWPRGLSKEEFKYNIWDKEIAPSTQLREWYHQDPENRWNEFVKKYEEELANNPGVKQLRDTLAGKQKVTLVYSSHDELHNNAVVLKKYLENKK